MSKSWEVRRRQHMRSPFELRGLMTLPCGCVVSDFRAAIFDLDLVSIEVKGPHCLLGDHSGGQVLAIGDRDEVDTRRLERFDTPRIA